MNETLSLLQERLAILERRVSALSDTEEISQLIASYGPAVDSGDAARTASLWGPTGTYSYPFNNELVTLEGSRAMFAMVLGDTHQDIIQAGAAHILTPPAITLNGDRATAVSYSMLVRNAPHSGNFEVWRVSANRWELSKQDGSWLVEQRENRLMEGDSAARNLLRTGEAATQQTAAGSAR